jgi:ribonucleoside-diphosphate reductase alpha chain
MIEEVVKFDGSEEPFIAKKINGWGKWSAKGYSKYINWADIVTKTVSQMPSRVTSSELNQGLIRNCIDEDTWAGQLMAGRLYAIECHKEVFGSKDPLPLKTIHTIMQAAGVMVQLDYSDEEYVKINRWINHRLDYDCAHYQLKQGRDKYALRNRLTGRIYETRQLALMRVAMVVCEREERSNRMARLKSFFADLSEERISAPTPNHNNMGTGHNGFFSCCLYTSDDTKESIATTTHIAEVMTYMSAGLGCNHHVRSLGDPIRGGAIIHNGKAPYFNKQTGVVKSNKQGSRGGSLTEYFSAFDPEVKEMMVLKNPRTPLNKRNRNIDYCMMMNRFLLWKSAGEENVFLFNCFTAPDLYAALYGKDLALFAELYEKYEKDESFKKTWISARWLVVNARSQGFETGRFYKAMIDTINHHTPHRDNIFSSNLCVEITQPTYWYKHIMELYSEKFISYISLVTSKRKQVMLSGNQAILIKNRISGPVAAIELQPGDIYTTLDDPKEHKVSKILAARREPEVSLCALGAIIVTNCKTEEQYQEACYNLLYMIDFCIDVNDYALPHMKLTAQARRNAGVGIMDLAHYMALKGLKYNTKEGYEEMHRVAERHMYWLIQASIRLAKERGCAEWIHKTDWVRGWTPQATYSREVDALGDFVNVYDWKQVSQDLIDVGGGRFSSLCAHMPGESSSKYSACTNSLMGLRYLSITKKDGSNSMEWVAPEADTLKDQYTIMWDLTRYEQINLYAIFQKWADQSISADFYAVIKGDDKIDSLELVKETNYASDMGLKTWYYTNVETSDKEALKGTLERIKRDVPMLEDDGLDLDGPVCTGGGCGV